MGKTVFVLINSIGGFSVLLSYFFSLKDSRADAFWGGTPPYIRIIYTISMILAAFGYFAFLCFIIFKSNYSLINFKLLNIIFLGILLPSILWMPLTKIFLENPISLLWILIMLVLALVGISSCFLAWSLIKINLSFSNIPYLFSVIGSIYFAFHTAILDMILWPIFFKMH